MSKTKNENNLTPREVKVIQLALQTFVEDTSEAMSDKKFNFQARTQLNEMLTAGQGALTKITKASGYELKLEPYHPGDEAEFVTSEPKEPSVSFDVKPYTEVTGKEMREMGLLLQALLPELGWALLVFPFHEPGVSNYIANAQREDMVTALREAANRLAGNEDFPTPEAQ
jgi:hypothetical protein